MDTSNMSTLATPVGSSIFYIVSLILVALLVVGLISFFLPIRTTPAYLLVPVFLAIALPTNLIILVPIDLASNPVSRSIHGIWLPERALLVAWRISYWLTFGLTWIILPLLGEYVDSGEREWRDKMIYSLRSNGRYQAMVLAAGTVGAVYFTITEGFNPMSLRALVMALAYAWGLILAIYLMGHGLVAIPRKLFRDADAGRKLRRLQSEAPKIYEKLVEATDELQGYEYQVKQLDQFKSPTARDFKDWILELVDMTSLHDSRVTSVGGTLPTSRQNIPQVITARYLADLTRKLKRARHKKLRYISEWDNLLDSALQCQAILDAKPSGRLTFTGSKTLLLPPNLRYQLHAYILPATSYLGGFVLALASFSILWSELTKKFAPHLSPISRTILPTKALNVTFFPSQLFAAFWISYMSACALYSITVLPIWGNRALVRRTTYAESASWYSAQVAKLTVPLAYNFLTFLPTEVLKKTMFYRFLGQYVDLTPLGRGFSSFFPILLLFPALAALFGWYGRIKAVLGFEDWLAQDEREDMWREGKTLIDRHGRQRGGVGLDVSPGSEDVSVDIPREPYRSAPSTTTPSASTLRPARTERPARAYRDDDGADEEEGGFFTDFSHRVRNTFDSVERPSWLKWGDNDDGDGGDRSWDWNRVFGGGPGHVRL